MNKFTNLLIISTVLLSFALVSCGKDDEKPDTDPPTVELRDPFENKTYNRGAALPLDVTFSDKSGMKSCVVSITYNDVAPATQLKGIGTPWAPAENNETDDLVIKGTKGGETVTKAKLFDQNIEAACLGGSYTITFDMEDNVGNKSQKTVTIVIGG